MGPRSTTVIKMDPRDPDLIKIREISRACREGKVVAFPTETVYGIGGPMNVPGLQAVIANIKYRDPAKPLSFHIADLGMLDMLDVSLTPALRFLSNKFWPGPVTTLVHNRRGETVGIRYPRSTITSVLIHSIGVPFLGTSANISGQPSPVNAEEVRAQLDGQIDFIIDAGPCELGKDSTIVDMTKESPEIVREGADLEAVRNAIGTIRSGAYPQRKILIVCTGNSCRSPMAEGWLKRELYKARLSEKVEVSSCGVGAREGASSTMEAVLVMKNHEIDISSHRSRPCTREDISTADLIIAMSEEHAFFIQNMMPQAKSKIRVLNIPDPIGMGMMIYEQVFQAIEKKLRACWSEIIR